MTPTRTPQLPFKRPQIPSNRDHIALNGGTLGGVGRRQYFWDKPVVGLLSTTAHVAAAHLFFLGFRTRGPSSSSAARPGSGSKQEALPN